MSGTLFTPDKYYRSYPIQVAAELNGSSLKVSSSKSEGGSVVPLSFESADGVHLFEPNAIAFYLASDHLRGGTDKQTQSSVLQWCIWADSHIVPAMATWVYPTMGVTGQPGKSQIEKAREAVREAFQKLNAHLETRTFLVGERVTLADITVAFDTLLLFQHVLDSKFREAFPHVERWFLTIVNQPASLKVLGESVQLCKEEALYDAKKYTELHPKGDHGHHRGGPPRQRQRSHRKSSGTYHDGTEPQTQKPQHVAKKQKEKIEKPPVQETPADDNALEDEPAAPKEKDPFLKLPKGTMDLDEWKRTYSNNDIETVAMPWLWEHFDPEHYSIWQCDYKYNNELSLIFKTCNLVGGMFQRLDKMRKHAFGSVSIYGENNNNCISGCWMWRGTGLAFELDSDLQLDYEHYDWKKLDHTTEESRKLITDYFIQRGEVNGKKYNQGKVFK
jgi:elongation factor 1-gamma